MRDSGSRAVFLFFGCCCAVAGRVAPWSVVIRITELRQALARGIRITRLRIRIRISGLRQASLIAAAAVPLGKT